MIGDQWSDLSVEVFLAMRDHFFDACAAPKSYPLRDKRNTQDDPLDEYICQVLQAVLPSEVKVEASGPLVTPDLVVHRPRACNQASRSDLRASPKRIIALEVKKLERGASGRVARASGLDYNSTPPCGTVRVYDLGGNSLDVQGCYLFLCQEPAPDVPRTYRLTSLVLCDGDLLNEGLRVLHLDSRSPIEGDRARHLRRRRQSRSADAHLLQSTWRYLPRLSVNVDPRSCRPPHRVPWLAPCRSSGAQRTARARARINHSKKDNGKWSFRPEASRNPYFPLLS